MRNLLAQVERYGFVPNGNRTYYLCRSQPPYLAPMVGLLDHALGDKALRQNAVPLLTQEYEFWTTRRLTPTGLSRYGHHATAEELMQFFPTVRHRLGQPDARPEDHLDLAGRTMAECESGWDLTSRYDRRCPDFCPVDLNSNLWLYEILLARWTDGTESDRWLARAQRRREWINTFCWDAERSVFCDYDTLHQRHSPAITAAAFQPLWTGLASEEQAAGVVAHVLPLLEYDGASPRSPRASRPAPSSGIIRTPGPASSTSFTADLSATATLKKPAGSPINMSTASAAPTPKPATSGRSTTRSTAPIVPPLRRAT